MPLSVIPGTYKIKGASPDGDSIRFYPDDPDVWTKQGIKAKPNAQGGVQLRLDAIDALETHYTPPTPGVSPKSSATVPPLNCSICSDSATSCATPAGSSRPAFPLNDPATS